MDLRFMLYIIITYLGFRLYGNGSHCAACSTQAQLAIFFLRYLQTSPWVLAKVVTAGNSVAMSSLR